MYVKIARLGSAVIESLANVGDTVREVLDDAGVAYTTSDSIKINNMTASLNTALVNRDQTIITITPAVKGGADFFVKVSTTGGSVQEILVNDTMTVEQAVRAAGMSVAGKTIMVDGQIASADQRLRVGNNLIVLSTQVKGGR